MTWCCSTSKSQCQGAFFVHCNSEPQLVRINLSLYNWATKMRDLEISEAFPILPNLSCAVTTTAFFNITSLVLRCSEQRVSIRCWCGELWYLHLDLLDWGRKRCESHTEQNRTLCRKQGWRMIQGKIYLESLRQSHARADDIGATQEREKIGNKEEMFQKKDSELSTEYGAFNEERFWTITNYPTSDLTSLGHTYLHSSCLWIDIYSNKCKEYIEFDLRPNLPLDTDWILVKSAHRCMGSLSMVNVIGQVQFHF
jgi:hypothetical protein